MDQGRVGYVSDVLYYLHALPFRALLFHDRCTQYQHCCCMHECKSCFCLAAEGNVMPEPTNVVGKNPPLFLFVFSRPFFHILYLHSRGSNALQRPCRMCPRVRELQDETARLRGVRLKGESNEDVVSDGKSQADEDGRVGYFLWGGEGAAGNVAHMGTLFLFRR